MKFFNPSFSTKCGRLAVLVAGLLSLPLVCLAFPPAPYHVIFGQVRDEYGLPLTVENAQIILTIESTNPALRTEIVGDITPDLEPGVNYRLNLPMDSLIRPDLYKPTALMPAAPFRLRVKIGNVTYLPMEMSANFANLGKPAQTTRINLTLGVDANNDGLPDAWQQLLIDMLGPGAKIGPNDDADGDGISNLNEYLAGTYAFDPSDGFRISILPGTGGTNPAMLEFTVVNPRTYTVMGSTNLVNWAPLNFKIPADGPAAPTLPYFQATDVHTLRAQPIFPPGPTPSKYFFKVQVQ
jgi:hypothetical protein